MPEPSITSEKVVPESIGRRIRKPSWSKKHDAYVVCLRGNKKDGQPELIDHRYPKTLIEVAAFVRLGYSVRMKIDGENDSPLITYKHIQITGCDEEIDETIDRLNSYPSNDGNYEARYRKEQSQFRSRLLNGDPIAPCVLCGKIFPAKALVASHIKPRHLCNTQEQNDIRNWTLMCSLGCDFLFEHHYIEVADGKIVFGTRVLTEDLAGRIQQLVGRLVTNWESAANYYKAKFNNNN